VSEGTNRNLPARNMLLAMYINPESNNAHCSALQTDGQTDDISWSYCVAVRSAKNKEIQPLIHKLAPNDSLAPFKLKGQDDAIISNNVPLTGLKCLDCNPQRDHQLSLEVDNSIGIRRPWEQFVFTAGDLPRGCCNVTTVQFRCILRIVNYCARGNVRRNSDSTTEVGYR